MIGELLSYVLIVVVGIVPIVNPFSTAPVFISLTARASQDARHRVATRACIYMIIMLLAFLLLGALILQFFGISLKSLRIAGGLVIAYMGFRMLFPSDQEPVEQDDERNQDPMQIAFTPLTMPMLAGPGAISVVLTMATTVSLQEDLTARIAGYAVVATGIVLSAAICWSVLWSAGAIVRFLGKSGIDAATKLMGFLLICMGVEFVLSGWAMP